MGFVARGRDLRTDADGTASVVDEVVARGAIAPSGELLSIEASTDVQLGDLLGGSVRRGFRALVDAVLPGERDARTLLHLLLDDLTATFHISGYGDMREMPAMALPPGSVERMVDVCAGWQGGATMMLAIRDTGLLPTPVGPPAPELATAGDPIGWHELAPVEPGEMRRRRRLDLVAGELLLVDAMFRDTHRPSAGVEDVLHEYEVAATIDPSSLTVVSAEATPRVLPWPECPHAAASAGRIVGRPIGSLRAHVLEELTGTDTCTHLNNALRSLADVAALVAQLP
jgi:hypothetical protein